MTLQEWRERYVYVDHATSGYENISMSPSAQVDLMEVLTTMEHKCAELKESLEYLRTWALWKLRDCGERQAMLNGRVLITDGDFDYSVTTKEPKP